MTTITGKNVLVLGGAGMVGTAVCRELLAHDPSLLVVAARRSFKARAVADELRVAFPDVRRIEPAWGDVFLRAEWQREEGDARQHALADPARRRRLIADVLEPLDDTILEASLLTGLITGAVPDPGGARADVVIDCMNTATAVSYQDIYTLTRRLASLAHEDSVVTDWPREVEALLAALSVPQLVRHVQILYAAMRHAGTEAYIKVGTSGTGGMGLNIPFTHGEEKPSRLLLSKSALAGAQSMLTFLLARTPDGPTTVREIKPAALIGWREIGAGPITRGGRAIPLYDCPPADAVSVGEEANLVPSGSFGSETGGDLEGVYIDTGENGLYAADEFMTITGLGLMECVTPEEVARNLVHELVGGSTGRDVIAALDGSVMGPSFQGGALRQTALARLRRLEQEHGRAVAYELLGPPRVSKLLFEAHLLERCLESVVALLQADSAELATTLQAHISAEPSLRRRILSIGIPILLKDGERLLRGPQIKAANPEEGWVDLTPENMRRWQRRLMAMRAAAEAERDDTSSGGGRWPPLGDGFPDPGEAARWVLLHEEAGERTKD